nr:hypothetical protein [Tanacetum cinerariifolium]
PAAPSATYKGIAAPQYVPAGVQNYDQFQLSPEWSGANDSGARGNYFVFLQDSENACCYWGGPRRRQPLRRGHPAAADRRYHRAPTPDRASRPAAPAFHRENVRDGGRLRCLPRWTYLTLIPHLMLLPYCKRKAKENRQ